MMEQLNQDTAKALKATQKRQGSQRRQAEKERDALMNKLQDDLTALEQAHAADLVALRVEHLNELRSHVDEKSDIERKIHESNTKLQRAYRAATQEIRCAVEGRVADLTPQ